jgi:Flp pilus assembly protein TadD
MLLVTTGCDKARSDSVRLTNQGMKALSSGDLREARIRFQEAVEIFPENAKAHYGLGLMLYDSGENERAKKHLKEATKLDSQLTEAFYQLGSLAVDEERTEEAEQELRRALDLDPEHSAALYLVGKIHDQRGELKQADRNYRQSVTLNPLSPQGFLALARLYQRVGAESEAEAVLREGLRVCSTSTVDSVENLSLLFNELGVMLQAKGQYGQAIELLLKAIRLPKAQPQIVFNLGWAYASKGESALALKYFNQFIQLSDDGASVQVARDVARHLAQRLAQERGTKS